MTTVTLYTQTLKEAELAAVSENELTESESIFDENLNDFIGHVRACLQSEGFDLIIDNGQSFRSYDVDADSAEDEQKAHDMMAGGRIGGFWEWYC